MNKKSMTATVSCFARAYHFRNYDVRIFTDSIAYDILGYEIYNDVSRNMSQGISFFNSTFTGSNEEGVKWIVNKVLSPTPLGRSAYTLEKLKNSIKIGAKQYLIWAAGYESLAYISLKFLNDIEVFEIDHPNTQIDKIEGTSKIVKNLNISNLHYLSADFSLDNWIVKLKEHPKYNSNKISFNSLMGLSYYLSPEEFKNMITKINSVIPKGSSIVFDYFDKESFEEIPDASMKMKILMAKSANEEMKGSYSYTEIESLLSECGLLIYEHLKPDEITKQYFKEFNDTYPNDKMVAEGNINYLLAVKE